MSTGDTKRILIVDDDEPLVKILSLRLSRLNHSVDGVTTAAAGFELGLNGRYDLIILDVLMPKRSGLEICSDLRSRGVITPILMLTGKTDKKSVVECLEAGADDYLTKPFSQEELVARINALVRRNKKSFTARFVRQYEVELDTSSHAVRFDKKVTQLTEKEVLLLQRLMYSSPELVSKEALLEDVWGIDDSHSSNRLEVYIRRLRDKLEEISGTSHIHTIRGKGYYFGEV
jgi:DNA-binding response OmpR family regulator